MIDPSGNEIDTSTENSLQMRAYVMGNKVDTAIWELAHAGVGKKTKDQMLEAMNKATEIILGVRKELVGR